MSDVSMLTQEVPLNKIESFEFRKINNRLSSLQDISINGMKITGSEGIGSGIDTVAVKLDANDKPVLSITYNPSMIHQRLADELGIYKE